MSSVVKSMDGLQDVRRRVGAAEWEARVQLAACYRLVAHYGWTDLIYTHISARVPGPENHYLLNPFGMMFHEITASSLVKIDVEGNIIDPTPHRIHKAGFIIHSAIHAAREDAHCVIHSHTRAGMAVPMMKCGLLPLTQHAMLFHGRIGYHDSEGFALETDERKRLAANLGDKCILMLRNHGTLVAGSSVPEAFSMMWHLEKAMQAQVDGMASGQELTMPSAAVAEQTASMGFTGANLPQYSDGRSPLGWMEWPALVRMLDAMDPSYRN